MTCTARTVKAQDDAAVDQKVCTKSVSPITVKVDADTKTVTFTCGEGFQHLWPAESKEEPSKLTEYFTDDGCQKTEKLTETFGEKSTLQKKTAAPTVPPRELQARDTSPVSYTLTLGSLPDAQQEIYFTCANKAYSPPEQRSAPKEESCVVKVVVPKKPTPPLGTCVPGGGAMILAVSTAGGSAAFKCGEENSKLLPSDTRVFSEDCQHEQSLIAAIPSAQLSSSGNSHTLTVPKLPQAGATICYKCVDKENEGKNQCSVKISVSGSESSGVAAETVSGFLQSALTVFAALDAFHSHW
ncbi:SAG-related sequence [Besnoitia besnoiti]|uniref:SAG-related sequence n=1 Tax=Besnoitia besnoiti TaxID=94643 RepID=A0A2A9MIX3_BESBE|nr:SAG-related sequence [Besnoitia besnoiti]PFH35340.1 SAG-related sequence [Besnoitia besnoiti]